MTYSVAPLETDEQRQALCRLWQENSYDPETNVYARERFEWLYRRSSAADAQTWLAVDDGHRSVVGCASFFRSNRYFRGQVVRGGVPAVFFVQREHRLAAAALAVQRAVLAGGCRAGFDVFVGKPNRQARAICDRVGYQPIADLQDWVRVVWGDESLSTSPNPVDYVDAIVKAADERFDDLWHRAKGRYPMAAEKTAAFLNWRYSGFTENYRFYQLLRKDDDRLVGCIVFYTMSDGAVVTDLLCEEPSGPLLKNLLLGFCARIRDEGHVWISLWYAGMPSFEEELAQIGFRRGKHRRTLVAYVNPDASLRTELLDRHNWFIFAGEMDVLLSDEVWRPGSDRTESAGRNATVRR